MNHLIRLLTSTPRALFASLAVVALLPAQTVPPWLALRQMEVQGATYARDDLASVLASDFDTVRLLRRGLTEDVVAEIAERITTVHQVGGHRAAKATAQLVDGHLQVTVQPGARYRWGAVRCKGNQALSTEQIAVELTSPPTPPPPQAGQPNWTHTKKPKLPLGEFADTTASKLQALRDAVVTAYEDIGRYGAEVRVELTGEADTLDLVVHVDHEGDLVTIGDVTLDGDPDEDAAKAIAAWAAPTPGQPATKQLREQLRIQVESTGRYYKSEVTFAERDGQDQRIPVIVKVACIPEPPPFDQQLLANAAWVDRALSRVLTRIQAGEQIELGVQIAEEVPLPPMVTIHPGLLRASIGTDGLAVQAPAIAWGEGPSEPFGARLGRGGFSLTLGDRQTSFAPGIRPLSSLLLQLTTTLDANGESEMRWGMVASGDGAAGINIHLHASSVRAALDAMTSVRRDGDDLVLQMRDTTIRLGPDGELREEPIAIQIDDTTITLGLIKPPPRLPTGAEDSAPALDDPGSKILATVLGQTTASPKERERIQAMVRCLITAGIALPTNQRNEQAPTLGTEASQPPSMIAMIAGVARQPCVRRDWSGHIIPACACATSFVTGDMRTSQMALEELVQQRGAGPLFVLPMAALFGLTNNQRLSDNLRGVAKRRWSFDSIWDDAADLLANFPTLAGVPARTGALLLQEPALEEMFAGLQDGPDVDAKAFRLAVRYWWDHGGDAALKKLCFE